MLKKEYIREDVLRRKLSVRDRYIICNYIKERYHNLSEWDATESHDKLAVEMKKLIELYIIHNNPALYEIYQKHPSICETLDGISIIGFINSNKLDSIYTEEKSEKYSKAVVPINITVDFSKMSKKPPVIISEFVSLSSFMSLNNWVTSNIDKIPEVSPIITRIRTLQNEIFKISYRRVNDKLSDLFIVSSDKYPYSYTIDFKNRKDLLTVEDLFDFDPELFISFCRSKGIMSYLKTWRKSVSIERGDDLDSMIEKLKNIL